MRTTYRKEYLMSDYAEQNNEFIEAETTGPSVEDPPTTTSTDLSIVVPTPCEPPPPGVVIATKGGRHGVVQNITPGPDTEVMIATDPYTRIVATPKMVAEIKCAGMPWPKALEVLLLCRRSGIDPFGGEVFLDKRRNDRGTYDYTTILSKRAFFRLAQTHTQFSDMKYEDFPRPEDCTESKPPVWGKALVWRKDWEKPYEYTLFYDEAITCVGVGGKPYRKSSGYCVAQPRQYLRLVCLARAFRDAFADSLNGFYLEEEIK
jgi:hypothetical protein